MRHPVVGVAHGAGGDEGRPRFSGQIVPEDAQGVRLGPHRIKFLNLVAAAAAVGAIDNPVPEKEGEQPVQAKARPKAPAEDKPKCVPAGAGPVWQHPR